MIFLICFLRQPHLNKLYGRGKKLSKPKAQNTKNPCILIKEKKEINDRIIRDIRTPWRRRKLL